MSACEVNDPTLSYVLCLHPLLFWLVVGVAPPEHDEAAISEAHCVGGNRAQALQQTSAIELEYTIRAEFFIRMLSYRLCPKAGAVSPSSHLYNCLKFLPGTNSSVRLASRASRSLTLKKRVRNTPFVLILSTQTFSSSLRTCWTIFGWR